MINSLFEKASEYFSKDRFQESWDTIQEILDSEPGNLDAIYWCGLILAKNDQHIEAKEYFHEVINQGCEDSDLFYNLGFTHFVLKEYKEAIPFFERSYALQNESNSACYYLCNIGGKLREKYLMSKHIESTLKLEIVEPEAMDNIAFVLHLLGRAQESLNYYLKILLLKPETPYIYFNLGTNYFNLGRIKEAEVAFRKQMVVEPVESNFVNLANLLIKSKRYEEAIVLFNEAIETFGRKQQFIRDLGACYIEVNRQVEAKMLLEEVLSNDEDDIHANYYLGGIYTRMNLHVEASRYYKRSIVKEPAYLDARLALAQCHARLGEFKLTEELLSNTFKDELSEGKILETLGLSYALKGDIKSAIGVFEKVLKIKGSVLSYRWLLRLYRSSSQIEKIIELYPKYISDEPSDPQAYVISASSLFSIGADFYTIFDILEEGLQKNPDSPEILVGKASLFLSKDDRKTSFDILNDAILRHPDNLQVNVAFARLLVSMGDLILGDRYVKKAMSIDPYDETVHLLLARILAVKGNFTKAYDILNKLVGNGTYLSEVYEALSQLPEEINPDKIRHFYRTIFDYETFVGLSSRINLDFLKTLDAPALIVKLLRVPVLENGILAHSMILEDANQKVRYFNRLFQIWRREQLNRNECLLIESIIYYHLGDPVHGCRCFLFEIDVEFLSSSMIAMYYYELCAVTTGIRTEFVINHVRSLRENYTSQLTDTESYYLALSLSIENNHLNAITHFEEISKSYLPAKYQICAEYQKLLVRAQISSTPDKISNTSNIQERYFKAISELTMFEDIDPLYRYGLQPIHPGIDSKNFLNDILPVVHYLELQEIIGSIFAIDHELESISELIILDELGQPKGDAKLIRDKIPEIYRRLVQIDLNQQDFESELARCKVTANLEIYIADRLYAGMNLEYFFERDRYENSSGFGFKFYLHLICRLFSENYLDFEQAIGLLYYLHYGIKRIPYKKDCQVINFFIDTVAELIIDSIGVPNLYVFQKLMQLNDLLKAEKMLKKPPLRRYEDFSKPGNQD